MTGTDLELVEGIGKVFRDLGDPDANLKQAEAILTALDGKLPIITAMEARRDTETACIEVDAHRISKI